MFDMQTFLTVLETIFSIMTSEHIEAKLRKEEERLMEEEAKEKGAEKPPLAPTGVAMPLQSLIDALSDSILPHGPRATPFGRMLYGSLNRVASLNPSVKAVELFTDEDISRFLSFVLRQVSQRNSIVQVSEDLHDIIVRSLLFRYVVPQPRCPSMQLHAVSAHRKGGEDKAEMLTLVNFLQRFPLPHHRALELLPLIEEAEFWRAAVVIHKQQNNPEAAVKAYLRAKDPVYRTEVGCRSTEHPLFPVVMILVCDCYRCLSTSDS